MLRRSDLLARKIDMERLKSMSKKGGAPAAAPAPAVKVRALLGFVLLTMFHVSVLPDPGGLTRFTDCSSVYVLLSFIHTSPTDNERITPRRPRKAASARRPTARRRTRPASRATTPPPPEEPPSARYAWLL